MPGTRDGSHDPSTAGPPGRRDGPRPLSVPALAHAEQKRNESLLLSDALVRPLLHEQPRTIGPKRPARNDQPLVMPSGMLLASSLPLSLPQASGISATAAP